MSERFRKVCLYGAGAVGGWLGVGLGAAGCELSAVARGATLSALKEHGLRVQEVDAAAGTIELRHCPVHASDEPAELGVQDLVVVAVKAPALPEIAPRLAPLLGPDTVVLTAMNGVPWWFMHGFGRAFADHPLKAVDPFGDIAAAIPTERVIGCVVHASCSQPSPGLVRHHFGRRLIIGEPAGGSSERLGQLAGLLGRAGFEAEVSSQIQKDIWFKLWGNMTVNPVSAITGATTDLILDDDLVRNFLSAVMLEAREIGARIGIPIAQQPEDRHDLTRKLGAFKTSMLQDAEAGRAVELDALVGAVRELGQLTGVATPFTDALLGLARLHAHVHNLY